MNRKYRKTVIAGNWKMNMLASEIKPFMEELRAAMPSPRACDVVLCTPAVMIPTMVKAGKEAKVAAGGQDVSKFDKGAYTGEVSASQLQDIGAKYCIVGPPSAASTTARTICSSTPRPKHCSPRASCPSSASAKALSSARWI